MLSTWLKRSKQTHASTSSSTDKCNDTTAPNSDSTNSKRYLEATKRYLEATAQSKDAKKRKSGFDAAWTETYPWLQSLADGDGKCKV